MASRTKGACRVYLYAPGCRYQMQYPGIGIKHKLHELHGQGQLVSSQFDASALKLYGLQQGVATLPSITYVDLPNGLGGMTSAGYLDAGQDVDLTHWTTSGGAWEAIRDYTTYTAAGNIGHFILQRDATADTTVKATSTFEMPPNPIIAISLWRGEPVREANQLTTPAYTRIGFGLSGHEYGLFIPYGGEAPYVARYHESSQQYQRLESEGSPLPAVDGIGKDERMEITIGVWNARIAVSFSRGGEAGQFTTFRIPTNILDYTEIWDNDNHGTDQMSVLLVPGGPIEVEHNAGQIAFRWWPIKMHSSTNTLYWAGAGTADYDCWYDGSPAMAGNPDATPAAARFSAGKTERWRELCYADTGTYGYSMFRAVLASDVTVTPYEPTFDGTAASGWSRKFTWRASWTPVKYRLSAGLRAVVNGAASGLDHYQGPILFGLQLRTDPIVLDKGEWPSRTDVTGEVKSVAVQYRDGAAVGTAGIELENHSTILRTAKDNQIITVEMGYEWSDASTDLDNVPLMFVGYIATPGKSAKVGPLERCDIIAFDPMIRMRDEKAMGMEPDFQVYSPKAAVNWLCNRAGIDDDQIALGGAAITMFLGRAAPDEEGAVNTSYGIGYVNNDSLVPAFGSELIRSAEEYCRFEDESTLECAPSRTAFGSDTATMWQVAKSAGQLADSVRSRYTVYEDAGEGAANDNQFGLFEVNVERVGMDSEQYADYVLVRGRDEHGALTQAGAWEADRLISDADPDWNGGWRHMHCETRGHAVTQADAQTRALSVLQQRQRRALRVTITSDLLIYQQPSSPLAIKRHDRIRIRRNSGSTGKAYQAGVLNAELRAVSVTHVYRGRRQWPQTIVEARSLDTT